MAPAAAPSPDLGSLTMAPAPLAAPMRDSFFDLPVELRLKVYEQLFCFTETIILALDETGVFRQIRNKDPHFQRMEKVPVHALLLNKKFYLEASPILYRCNKFNLKSAVLFHERLNRNQTVCKLLEDLEVDCCGDDLVWEYTRITKYLSDCMPSLRKLNFTFGMHSFALVAASVEFSSAITPCASMFPGPTLKLCGHILTQAVSHPGAETAQGRISSALVSNPKSLASIVPSSNRHIGSLMHTELDLPGTQHLVIQLTGRITPHLLGKIQKHTCTIGDCTWAKTHEDDNPEDPIANGVTTGRRTHLRWGTADTPTPKPKPVNMLQFYPEMSERDQKILKEFLKSYNRTETSEKKGPEASVSARPTVRQRIEQYIDVTAVTETGRDGVSADDDSTTANNEESTANDDDDDPALFDPPNSDALHAPVATPEHVRSLRTVTLADYDFDYDFDDDHLYDEDTQMTPAEINAAWNEQFGMYGTSSLVGSSIGTQSSGIHTSGHQTANFWAFGNQTSAAANEETEEASNESMAV